MDERHKLAIVAALNKSSYINTACLIVNSQEGLSGSVTTYLKQYVKLLERMSVTYVVIHTVVDYSKITGADMEQRKLDVDKLLGVYGHHYMI